MDVFFPLLFLLFSPAKGIEVSPNPAAARHQTVINELESRLYFIFCFLPEFLVSLVRGEK